MTTKKQTTERKQVKKLTINIVDSDAVFAAYPALNREDFVKTIIDKSRLRKRMRPIVKTMYDLGQQVPGIEAHYASEESENADPKSVGASAAPSSFAAGASISVGAVTDELKDIPAHLRKVTA